MLKKLLFMMLSVFLLISCGKASLNQMVKPASESKIEKKEVNQQKQMESHKKNIKKLPNDMLFLEGRIVVDQENLELFQNFIKDYKPYFKAFYKDYRIENGKSFKAGDEIFIENVIARVLEFTKEFQSIHVLATKNGVFKLKFKGVDFIDFILQFQEEYFNERVRYVKGVKYLYLGNQEEFLLASTKTETVLLVNLKLEDAFKELEVKRGKLLLDYKKLLGKNSSCFLLFDYESLKDPLSGYPLFHELKGGFFEYSYKNKTITLQLKGDLGSQNKQATFQFKELYKEYKPKVLAFMKKVEQRMIQEVQVIKERGISKLALLQLLEMKDLVIQVVENMVHYLEIKEEGKFLVLSTQMKPITESQKVFVNLGLLSLLTAISIPAYQGYHEEMRKHEGKKERVIEKNSEKKSEKKSVKGLLWKVEHKKGVSYLYGHTSSDNKNIDLGYKVERAFKASGHVLVPVDDKKKNDKKKNDKRDMLKAKKPLSEEISSELYQKILDIVGHSEKRRALVNNAGLIEAYCLISFIKDSWYGYVYNYNDFIVEEAYKLKKEVLELYSLKELHLIKHAYSKKDNIRKLEYIVDLPPYKILEDYERTKKAWEAGDISALSKLMEENHKKELKRDPIIREKNKRLNALLMKRKVHVLENYCLKAERNCFLSLNAYSFIVKNGNIIEILRKKGYKVTRIK